MKKFMNIDEMWKDVLVDLINQQDRVIVRSREISEIIGYQATLVNTQQSFLLNSRRRLNPHYAAAEILWYLSYTKSITMLKAYAPQYEKFCEFNGLINEYEAYGSYGDRIAFATNENQIALIISALKKDACSRQAVLTIFRADDLSWSVSDSPPKDIPCTICWQFLARYGELHMITTMRSNDIWLGMPYDVFAFTCIQRLIADALGLSVGSYTHQVGSVHLYEDNRTAAMEATACFNQAHIRLEHQWYDRVEIGIHEEIYRALLSEKTARTALLKLNTLPTNQMLRDLVLCAANKWNSIIPMPDSPILSIALRNFV